jgi:hypothetical protein
MSNADWSSAPPVKARDVETKARELLACPFCGNDKPKIRSNGIGDFYVVCVADETEVHCEASTSDRCCETVEGAIRRWNRRSATEEQARLLYAEIKSLRVALQAALRTGEKRE